MVPNSLDSSLFSFNSNELPQYSELFPPPPEPISSSSCEETLEREVPRERGPLMFTIPRAHRDDIQALTHWGNILVTGSKDCRVKGWEKNGRYLFTIIPERPEYRHWITAVAAMGLNLLVASRNGYLYSYYNEDDQIVSNTAYLPPHSAPVASKERNQNRIHCIDPVPDNSLPNNYALLGTNEDIHLYKLSINERIISYVISHQNQWVYAIKHLPGRDCQALVVHGANLSLYSFEREQYNRYPLIREPSEEYRKRNHFLSSLCLLPKTQVTHAALSVFNGSVIINDLEHGSERVFKEHEGRCWSVISLEPENPLSPLASGADDGCVKIWDQREAESVRTIREPHEGRVSVLTMIGENQLVSGSCPDDPFTSINKGMLAFFDLRV